VSATCQHNTMIRNEESTTHVWKCADCGYVYGSPTPTKKCPNCYGTGQWETECCNGSGGCDCRGQPVPMGRCNVCGGSGEIPFDESGVNFNANCDAIRGLAFIGRGPTHGIWANMGKRGQP